MTRLGASGIPSVEFYARDTIRVARDLLGYTLESRSGGKLTTGRIVEVEAYVGPDDPADHGYGNRRTPRNQCLFGAPGTAYVFRSYGIHWCFNAVTEREGHPTAVLVRALEPLVGLATMIRRRGVEHPRLLCAGPGRLCQALGITGEHDGIRLDRWPIRIRRSSSDPPRGIRTGPRIGISRARERPLRFYLEGPWVSR